MASTTSGLSTLLEEPPLGESPVVDAPSCRLLGPTALIVQGLMGILVILSLVYKRHREYPKRPWRIWLFDVAKQIVGQMFVHGTNVLLSDVLSRVSSGNACTFYFLNILVDTTLGVGVIYVVLRALTSLFTNRLQLAGFETGKYGDPPSFNFWIRQAVVYVLSITTMKLLVVALFALWPGIFQIGQWMLSWTGDGSNFQIVFTMGLFPIIMNILQFWLIDTIVKASQSHAVALETDSARASATLDRQPLFRASSDDEDDDDDAQLTRHDIENPAPRSRSPAPASGKAADTVDEQKSAATSVNREGSSHSFATHAYPPVDRATSPSSIGSAGKRRRSPPPRLAPRSPLQPALNSSVPALEDAGRVYNIQPSSTPPGANTSIADNGNIASKNKVDEWDLSWDGEDAWADRVGEEDWTGKRIEVAKGFVGDVWGSSSSASVRVGS